MKDSRRAVGNKAPLMGGVVIFEVLLCTGNAVPNNDCMDIGRVMEEKATKVFYLAQILKVKCCGTLRFTYEIYVEQSRKAPVERCGVIRNKEEERKRVQE